MVTGYVPTALRYRDVAEEIGLDKTSGGRGTAVFDIDGDGELDVIISAVSGGCSVYRNNGDGTFRDASVGSGLDACVNSWGISAGDFDNDGRTDLFVTRLGYFDGQAALYHNNGDGTFTDVTREAGRVELGAGIHRRLGRLRSATAVSICSCRAISAASSIAASAIDCSTTTATARLLTSRSTPA